MSTIITLSLEKMKDLDELYDINFYTIKLI